MTSHGHAKIYAAPIDVGVPNATSSEGHPVTVDEDGVTPWTFIGEGELTTGENDG